MTSQTTSGRNNTLVWKSYLALSTAVWIWGFSNISLKHLLTVLPPTVVAFFSTILAATAFWSSSGKRVLRELRADDLGLLACGGLFGTFGFNFLHNIGLRDTTAINASLIVAMMPAFGLIASHLLRECRITPGGCFGCVFSMAGTGYLVSHGSLFTLSTFQMHGGDLYIVGSVCSLVCYASCVRQARQRYSPTTIATMQVTVGAFLFLPFAIGEHFWRFLPRFDHLMLGAVVYVGICRSVGANLCYTYALRKVPVAIATLFTNGTALVTAFFACLLLNESLQPFHAIAAALILTGVTIATRSQQQGVTIESK